MRIGWLETKMLAGIPEHAYRLHVSIFENYFGSFLNSVWLGPHPRPVLSKKYSFKCP